MIEIRKTINVGEVYLSYKKQLDYDYEKIESSKDAARILRSIIPEDQISFREHSYALYLDNSNNVLKCQHLSAGSSTGTMMDPRIIFQGALLTNSVAFILCHNHPSGKTKPSIADLEVTAKIAEGGKILDIKLLDHIIITANSYYSLADNGNI